MDDSKGATPTALYRTVEGRMIQLVLQLQHYTALQRDASATMIQQKRRILSGVFSEAWDACYDRVNTLSAKKGFWMTGLLNPS